MPIRIDAGSPDVLHVGERHAVWNPVTVHFVDEPWLPYDVDITIDSAGGVARCIEITYAARPGGSEVTVAGVRAVSMRELLRRARRAQDEWVMIRADSGVYVPGLANPAERSKYLAGRRREERNGRRRITDGDLRRVAEVYRMALATGQPPSAAVARELRLTGAQAARWVSKARDAGFLGQAPGPRQAGEIEEPRTKKPQPKKKGTR